MFGRKKYDDGDGDYIRPVEEYRDECEEYHSHEQTYDNYDSRSYESEYRYNCDDHEHGQTYRNYDSRSYESEYRYECDDSEHGQTYRNYDSRSDKREYRRECSDEHGQTYKDHNSEQKEYEKKEQLEKHFAGSLMPGEQILWLGESEKRGGCGAFGGASCLLMLFPIMWILFSASWMLSALAVGGLFFGIFGLPFVIVGIVLIKVLGKATHGEYAVTSERILTYRNGRITGHRIADVVTINIHAEKNNVGSIVYYLKRNPDTTTNPYLQTYAGSISSIKNPQVPREIIQRELNRINAEKRQGK